MTARNAPSHERALNTLKEWGVMTNDAFFLGGVDKGLVLGVLKPHIFFDDQSGHLSSTSSVAPSVHIPFGVKNLESVDEIIDLAVNMGIPRNKIPRVPSLALGVPSLNVLEMTSAYSTFSNNGIHAKPIFLKKIEDRNGNVIYENEMGNLRIWYTWPNFFFLGF